MSFVKLSIFGTSFEVSVLHGSPAEFPFPDHPPHPFPRSPLDMLTYSPLEWVRDATVPLSSVLILAFFFRSIRSCLVRYRFLALISLAEDRTNSSAKDQLTGVAVAVKKIMKPFSTPVLAKRTYRELKLLKHIQHENVRTPTTPP